MHNLTYCCKVSPNGKFVATSGFTSDVKVISYHNHSSLWSSQTVNIQIWEVKFSRSGDFEKVARAFNLSGHTSGVYSFSFSADSSRVATVSKDGTWKVFNTDIEYTKGQDASVVMSGSYDLDSGKPSKVTISPDGEMI